MQKAKSPNEIDVIVGGNVRRIRNLLGMSQETLGLKLELTFQQVQKYEKGTNRISASKLIAMTRALGCSIDQLFDGVDKGTAKVTVPQHTAAAMKVASNFDKIAFPAQRDAVAKLVASMAKDEAFRPALIAAE